MTPRRLIAHALLLALIALLMVLVPTQAQASVHEASAAAKGKISMKALGAVVEGKTWSVKGKISGTGKARNKTLLVDWNGGSGWVKIGVKKKVGDGKYSIKFSSATPGSSQLRARVTRNGRTLAKSSPQGLTVVADTTGEPAPEGGNMTSGLIGQVSPGNPLMKTYMDNVYANVYYYWVRTYASWGYGPPTLNGYYFPLPGEAVYDPCKEVTEVNDLAAYYCGPRSDWLIFSQAAAASMWNGTYANTQSQVPGDFAVAFTMAHEFGHNITFELWPDALTIFGRYKVEGFADCLAGTWANSVYYQGILEEGDLMEAIYMLIAFGDGAVEYPSGIKRAEFFALGYDSGSPADCANVIL